MRTWYNFLQRMLAGDVDVDERAFQRLLRTSLNGRQIKSAIKMATVLSKRENKPLSAYHVELCLKIRRNAHKALAQGDIGESRPSTFSFPPG